MPLTKPYLARIEREKIIILNRVSGKKTEIATEDIGEVLPLLKTGAPLPLTLLNKYDLSANSEIFWVQLPNEAISENALSFPLRVYFGLNNICNINCRMCYARKDIPEKPIQLKREEWLPILEVLDIYGLVEIRLGESGEPTINGQLLTDFLIDAKNRTFYISLTTNGQFNKDWANTWADLIDQPIFSIDGDREYHDWNRGNGTFDKAMENLKSFAGKTKELRVNTVFSKRTLKGLEELIKNCVDNGVDELCLLQLRPYNKAKVFWEEILSPSEWSIFIRETIPAYRQKYPSLRIRPDYDVSGQSKLDRLVDKKWQCSAGVQAFGIRPTIQSNKRMLKVYGCGYLCDEGDPFIAATISPNDFKTSFLEIWHNDYFWNVYRHPKRNKECISNCAHYSKTCFGQCTAMLRYAEINPDFIRYLQCPFSQR